MIPTYIGYVCVVRGEDGTPRYLAPTLRKSKSDCRRAFKSIRKLQSRDGLGKEFELLDVARVQLTPYVDISLP